MTNIRRMTPLFAVFILSLFLLSCTGNRSYQDTPLLYSTKDLAECNKFGDALEHIKEKISDYYLGFVEVDEQGVFFDRNQFKNLICELTSHAKSSGVLISVYVHGWHHNAKPDDENIKNFKKSLTMLSEFEYWFAQKKSIKPRKTIGIFIGWRGESIDFSLLSFLSFRGRKTNAEEIARRSILEAFLKLEKIRNIKPSDQPATRVNRLFVVGHSLGADVVYNALSPIMLERLIGNEKKDCKDEMLIGFGDFIFLINPAFESLQYINFMSLLQEKNTYCDNQFPIFSILTSEEDNATKHALPFFLKTSTNHEMYRPISHTVEEGKKVNVDQRDLDTTAIGHQEILITHRLENNTRVISSEEEVTMNELVKNDCNIMRDFRNEWKKEREKRMDILSLTYKVSKHA